MQWDSSTHPGPITHFLYGPVSDASQATGLGTWTKIDEFDYDKSTLEWANEVMEAQNMTYSFKLPSGLATGDYLLRSEMLALHGSQTLNGAQFYIGCAQLHITGSSSSSGGSCKPQIQLPGAYKATDADIYIPNFYNGFQITTYTAPGGPVATCGAGVGSGSGSGSGGGQPAPPVTTKKPATTTAAGSPRTTLATSTAPAQAGVGGGSSGGSVPKYGQCGGSGYTGATACVAGTTCTAQNQYYSQCL